MPETAPVYNSFSEMPQELRHVFKLAARIRWAREAAKAKDVLSWGRAVMPEIFYLPYCQEFHRYLVDIRGIEFTSTKGPRNHAKTSIGDVLIPMFQALEEPQDFQHYLTVQGSEQKALSLNRSIKTEIEMNEVIQELYGDQVGDRWTDQQFELANGVVFTAVSTGTSMRGLIYKNRRPDYIMPDDLYSEEHINNPDATKKVAEWFWGTLYPARAKTKRWAIHVTGTAINQYDLLTQMEKDSKTEDGNNIVCRTFKAIKDFKTREVLWPELHGANGQDPYESVMMDFRRMGTHIAMRELQNEPRDEASAIIKREWLYPESGATNWEYDPDTLKFDKHHFLAAVLLCMDPSIGEKMENDSSGTALIWKTMYDDSSIPLYYIAGLWNQQTQP